jgi:thiamine pyrophosphate-dependent acetolactate synthase large subunit-like protein
VTSISTQDQTRRRGPALVDEPVAGSPPEAARYASDRMLDLVRDLGCRFLPANPGSSFRGFHDSIVNYGGNRDPQLLLCHNELIAVSMAHGYAKAAQRTGYAVVHDLVGLMQASMGVYNALVDEVPLVLLGGGGPADTTQRRPIDWIHSASAQTNLVRDFVKWDAEPVDLQGTLEAIAQATRVASSAPMGPTYVTLDSAVQEAPALAGATDDLKAMAVAPTGLALGADEADRIARELLSADNPMIIVGPLGYTSAATTAVVELAKALDAPCLDVDHAAVVPSEFELNLTGSLSSLRDADLILALGVRDIRAVVESVRGRREGAILRPGLEGVSILDVGLRDLTLRGWASGGASSPKTSRQVSAEPIAATREIAAAVTDLRTAEPPDRARARRDRRDALVLQHRALLDRGRREVADRWNDATIAPARLVQELWDTVANEPWQLAMRNTRTFPLGVWRFESANDYLGHSGGAGVGYGPGAMVGAALGALEHDRLAVGIGGDGDFLMHPGALWTATHYRIPMLLVINDNASFYNDEDHQVAVALDRGRPAENGHIGMRMQDPQVDLAALARSYGAWASGPVEDPDHLRPALESGLEAAKGGATAIVHVRTAPT